METTSLLQNVNTIQLAVHYMLKCAANAKSNYYVYDASIYEEIVARKRKSDALNQDIDDHLYIQIGGKKIKHIKPDAIKIQILPFHQQNEKAISTIFEYYLKQNITILDWNELIADFYGANFHIGKRMDYTMPIKLKLKEWNVSTKLGIKEWRTVTKHIEAEKQYHPNGFIKLYRTHYFTKTNNRKEMIENLILRKQYHEALAVLNLNNDDEYPPLYYYYKDIYCIICYQSLYPQQHDRDSKNSYFLKMIDLLASLTNFMCPSDPLTCSLFADVLWNFNPNPLTTNDWIFIQNMVLASIGYLYSDIDPDSVMYQLCGSMDGYMLLLRLIHAERLSANDDIFRIVINNMDALFAMFDSKDLNGIHKASRCFTLKISHTKMLWEIEKKEILTSMNAIKEEENKENVDNKNSIDVSNECELKCNECGKTGFKNSSSLGSHKSHHSRLRNTMKHNDINPVIIKPDNMDIDTVPKHDKGKEEAGDSDQEPQTVNGVIDTKKEDLYHCDFCEYSNSHKGNMNRHLKRHLINVHKHNAKSETKTSNEAQAEWKPSKKSGKTTLKKKETKQYRDIHLKCGECGKICKTKSGLGVHKYQLHGIGGVSEASKKRKRILKIRVKKLRMSLNKKKCNKKKREIITIIDDENENGKGKEVEILKINKNDVQKKEKKRKDGVNQSEAMFMDTDDSDYHDYEQNTNNILVQKM